MIRCKIVSGSDIFLARSGIIFRVVSMDWTDFDFNKLVDKGIINLNMEKINIWQYSKYKDDVPLTVSTTLIFC